MNEVHNAVNQAIKEVETRFDFRGSPARIELDQKKATITMHAESDMKLQNLRDILETKMAKRDVSLRALKYAEPEEAIGGASRQVVTLQQGIPQEKAKEISKIIRDSKIKVTAQIQADQVRIAGSKKDDLQAVMALLRKQDFGFDLQFANYR